MGSKRIVGLDLVKGIAILMMIIVHSVTQVIADYDGKVFFSVKDKIPLPILYCVVYPIMIIGLWGTVFTMITAITTSLSAIRIMDNNPRAIFPYILQRWLFLVLLRLGECLACAFLSKEADPYNNEHFTFPNITFGGPATTLDSIGWSGLIAPFFVFCFYRMKLKSSIPLTIILFSVLSYLLFAISPFTTKFFAVISDFLARNQMGLLAAVLGKICYGRFKIAQTIPFTSIGTMFAFLLHQNQSVQFLTLLSSTYFVLGIGIFFIWLVIDKSFLDDLVSEDVPLPAQIVSFGCICLMTFVHACFVDGDRAPEKKLKSRKRIRYLLRLSMLSLTVFCIGGWVGRQLSLPWQAVFGPPCTHNPSVLKWNLWVCVAYTIFLLACWVLISIVWEKKDFVGSMEHVLGWVVSQMMGKKFEMNSRKFVYGPAIELEAGAICGEKVTFRNQSEFAGGIC